MPVADRTTAEAESKTRWVALWSSSTVAILGIDFFLPNIDLIPLIVVPLLGISEHMKLRLAILLAVAFAVIGTIVEAISDQRTASTLSLSINALFLACSYVVAVILSTCVRSLLGESRSLREAVRSIRAHAPRLFPQAGAETLGWRISVIDARRTHPRREFHHIVSDAEGCELIVGNVLARDLNDVLILSTLRGALSSRIEREPARRLSALNDRLLLVGDELSSCAAFCAFLDPDGVLRLASGGYGPAVVQRGNGETETIEGGGWPLGLFSEIRVSERLLFIERGERVLIAGNDLMGMIKSGKLTLREVVSNPEVSADKIRETAKSTGAFGVIVERCAAGPIERLTQSVLTHSGSRN